MVRVVGCIVLFVIADLASGLINNTQIEARNDLQDLETRRSNRKRGRRSRSTSSSSGAGSKESSGEKDTLSLSDSSSSTSKENANNPVSSEERRGWRKWHRKCTPCPEDMRKKWRDPTIKWVCGAYQRARRSFKSLCMMHYRNCQDGTMFVKIQEHRCLNSSASSPHGDHFFYEYRVVLSDDESTSNTESDTSNEESSSI